MSIRDDKAASLFMHLAGEYIAREAGRSTLITPTRVSISGDRKNLTIFVSVFPDSDSDNAMKFLVRHKDLFRDSLKKARLATLPYIHFELDLGEKNRQNLDEISRQIEENK